MSTFTTLRDKVEHMFAVLFGVVEPIGEHVVTKTSEDIAVAALTGTIHGSDDMINVAKASLQAQLPALKNEALTAAAALVAHDVAVVATQPVPVEPTPAEPTV